MRCPVCQAALPETGTECPACGADVSWYIRKPDGSTYGPLDLALIERCLREGRLVAGDMAQLGSEGRFRPAHELLGDRLVGPPPPTAAAAGEGLSLETRQWLVRGCTIAGAVGAIVVVLAILASIPAFRSARTRARNVSCQSNLKQINLALLMYAADWDDTFPAHDNWQPRLDPYVRNSSLWTCPGAPSEPGYAKNGKLTGRKVEDVRQPAQTLTFWDAGAQVQGFTPPPGTTSPRHNGSDNFGFVDGHVNSAPPGQLQAYSDP